jgi:hypothetical protein
LTRLAVWFRSAANFGLGVRTNERQSRQTDKRVIYNDKLNDRAGFNKGKLLVVADDDVRLMLLANSQGAGGVD